MESENKNRSIALIGLVLAALSIGIIIFLLNNKKIDNNNENQTEVQKEKITPLVYKVSKEGSKTIIYLFGTVHIGKLSNVEFPEYLNKAYRDSKYIAFETGNDDDANDIFAYLILLEKYKYNDGTTVKDHINAELYEKMMQYIKDNDLYEEGMEQYKPIYFIQLLMQFQTENSELSIEEGVDNYFIDKANSDNKIILEVESNEFQEDLLLSFPDRLYELMLESYFENPDAVKTDFEQLFEQWKEGNEKVLWESENEDHIELYDGVSDDDVRIVDEYYEKLDYNRNVAMVTVLEDYFNNNYNTLFMVGQGHIVGDKGIVDLLRQKNYTVEVVTD